MVMLSFTLNGTPSRAESGVPARQRASLALAASAASGARATRAFSTGFSLAIRASSAASASTGERAPLRNRAARAVAGSRQGSVMRRSLPCRRAA